MSQLLEQVLRVNVYLQPVQFFLAIITNVLNIRILCSRVLRLSACTHYFLAYAIFNIIYTCFLCPTQFLRSFHIDWANEKVGCKMHFYFISLVPVQAKVMLLLASFDRYCTSSQLFRCHSKNTIQTARTSILIGTILSVLYMSPMLVIYEWNEVSKKCLQRSNTLIHMYILSQIIFYYILAPILMIVFGFLTIYNIHQQSIRAKPQITSMRWRRTDGQLAFMLFLQVGVHLVFVLPFGVIYSMNVFDPSTRTGNILAVRYILVMWQQCDYFASFFLYILSGSVYRQELVRIVKSMRCHYSSSIQTFNHRRRIAVHEFPGVIVTPIRMNGVSV